VVILSVSLNGVKYNTLALIHRKGLCNNNDEDLSLMKMMLNNGISNIWQRYPICPVKLEYKALEVSVVCKFVHSLQSLSVS